MSIVAATTRRTTALLLTMAAAAGGGRTTASSSSLIAMSANAAAASASTSAGAAVAVRSHERTVRCSDGLTLAVRCWTSDKPAALPSPPSPAAGRAAAAVSVASSSSSDAANADGSEDDDAARRRILCLHGWLDNAASFGILAPALLAQSVPSCNPTSSSTSRPSSSIVAALDFPGHGLSDHRSPDAPPQLLAEYVYYVAECIDGLGWGTIGGGKGGSGSGGNSDGNDGSGGGNDNDRNKCGGSKVTLIGHSMGAGVATCFAAAFPDVIDRLVLLEGAGPLARNPADAARHVRDAVMRRRGGNEALYGNGGTGSGDGNGNGNGNVGRRSGGVRVYPSLEAAVEVRMKTARLSPGGRQYLSREAATAMVRRATVRAGAPASSSASPGDGNDGSDGRDDSDGNGNGADGADAEYGGPVTFRHDPRLQWPSLQYFTRDQVDALYTSVQSAEIPVCLLTAEDGWPTDSTSRRAVRELLRPAFHEVLGGSHHFHADPSTAGRVAEEVVKFLSS